MVSNGRRRAARRNPVELSLAPQWPPKMKQVDIDRPLRSRIRGLERSLDPTAGEADVYPQEISRVLINLISNGFYAAAKRREQAKGQRLRAEPDGIDQGTLGTRWKFGYATTALASQRRSGRRYSTPSLRRSRLARGLGLSISHGIIVKQHYGPIEVDTEPGEFAEQRIILSRGAA